MEHLTISEIKAMYSSGISPADLIQEITERSRKFSDYNIWITEPSMDFIAPYLEALEKYDKSQPLWGVPFAVKDNIDLAGVPTTAGCPDFAYTPKESAEAVKRLVKAGAIPIGKTNLDQFATGLVGTRSPYGECKNALNPEYISGGSSSGSAAAVAAGLCAFALGTDTAGSGRVPAALHGIYGFKPSFGAWPKKGLVPACESLDCITVFAANPDDIAAVDNAVRGYCEDDIWSENIIKEPKIPYAILVPDKSPEFFGDFSDEYSEMYERFKRSASEKFDVKMISCDLFAKAASMLYGGPWICERWAALGEFVSEHANGVFPTTREILESGKGEEYSAAELFKAQHTMRGFIRETKKLLNGAVLALPTCGGTFTRAQVRENPIETNSKMGLYTNHCNLLDLSAMAVPFGEFEADGKKFPFGITFFAQSNGEGMLEQTARAFI